MTQKETTQVLAILKAAYPNSYKGMTKEEAIGTVTVWAVQFADIPVEVVLIAVNKLIATNTFPPAICEVRKKIGSMYFEARETLQMHEKFPNLTEKQVEFYKMIESVAKRERYAVSEPTIRDMLGENNQLLLGGG